MVNITHKTSSLRKAIAQAVVTVSNPATIEAIKNNQVPKGSVFEFSKVAALFAVKKTSDVIPDCHPLPVEYTAVNFSIDALAISINVEVHTIYRTGVEVEAMHGAAIAALTMYDMLKPIDNNIEITHIKLLQKSGGKSQRSKARSQKLSCAVVVCSDTIAAGTNVDYAGKAVIRKLQQFGLDTSDYVIIPDDVEIIKQKARELSFASVDILLFTGGTGLSERDVTPEAIKPLITREIPGIMETARQYGQERMPFAMLSRGVAGFIDKTLVITLPGSTSGAEETMDALFPHVIHVFEVISGSRHSVE